MRILLSTLLMIASPAWAGMSWAGQVCDPDDQGGLEGCQASAELTIGGTVGTTCALEVTPTEKAMNLDIQGGETGTIVATVREMANVSAGGGYEVTVSSENGSELVNQTGSGSVSYQASYDGGALFSLTQTHQTVKEVTGLTAPADVTADFAVTFAGDQDASAGVYEDTITFEISAL